MRRRLKNSKLPDPKRVIQGRTNQQRGENVEGMVKNYLAFHGFSMVRKIHTNVKPRFKNKKIVGAHYAEAVGGDFRALYGPGLSCLIEVKHRVNDKFGLSMLEPHQKDALTDHNNAGGLSLVTWVTQSRELFLMRWPMAIIKHRRAISQDEARMLHEQTLLSLETANGTPWAADLYSINDTL